jgi:hypothetical protein
VEELPKRVSVHGAPPQERVREPVPAVLLERDGGWLLLDTGFNAALIRDPALRRRFFASPNYRPIWVTRTWVRLPSSRSPPGPWPSSRRSALIRIP